MCSGWEPDRKILESNKSFWVPPFFKKAASFRSFLKKASPKTFILFSLSGFATRGLAGKKITGLLSAGIDPVLGA
ncbi:hypothetical protein [Komagataeibacter nataicola]|uniref:hypothetical protein n=1 Tax=Komagataeibacter nataicola TaxID=265960 RepID=UPI00222E52FF|nr:hypothetical protein [Komagataeibacter nataicola]